MHFCINEKVEGTFTFWGLYVSINLNRKLNVISSIIGDTLNLPDIDLYEKENACLKYIRWVQFDCVVIDEVIDIYQILGINKPNFRNNQ